MDDRVERLEREISEIKQWVGILLRLCRCHAAMLAGRHDEALQDVGEIEHLLHEAEARVGRGFDA